MSRYRKLNRAVFDLVPMRPVGRWIFVRKRRSQAPSQSTATKFFRAIDQLSALDGPLGALTSRPQLRVLVAGCSMGCEAFSIAGHLALSHPGLDFSIDACDISDEALAIATAGCYGREHGLGAPERSQRERNLETRLFAQSSDHWLVVDDIRSRVHFQHANVLAPEFSSYRGYDCVFGQNFMIYMSPSESELAFAALVAALRPGGALFAGGMDSARGPAWPRYTTSYRSTGTSSPFMRPTICAGPLGPGTIGRWSRSTLALRYSQHATQLFS